MGIKTNCYRGLIRNQWVTSARCGTDPPGSDIALHGDPALGARSWSEVWRNALILRNEDPGARKQSGLIHTQNRTILQIPIPSRLQRYLPLTCDEDSIPQNSGYALAIFRLEAGK